jgi:hypothetical protein
MASWNSASHPRGKQGERVQVWGRRSADSGYLFPAIAKAVSGLSADEALLEGEPQCCAATGGAISALS